jgi:hypothetical protein
MDSAFLAHNSHLNPDFSFAKADPHLRRLKTQKLRYEFPILQNMTGEIPGIYSLTGGRQVGKTTLLKLLMRNLLQANVQPQRIYFFTGELIDDHHTLVRLIQEKVKEISGSASLYLFLDEVTYIRDWDKGIKFLADAGVLENTMLWITGSDLALIRDARMRFPGRRGKASQVNFHLHPLSFRETVFLKTKISAKNMEAFDPKTSETLFSEWQNYLIHGGFLAAMNDFVETGQISPATLSTYADWIRGDVLKHGKQETYLREILLGIHKRYGSQITWQNLAKDLSIEHHQTVADYILLLENMDVVFVQYALLEDKRTAAPKKAKKVIFNDPFIFHASRFWLQPSNHPFQNLILPAIEDPEMAGKLTEGAVVSHYRRHFPTFYIKAEGEVDLAYIKKNRFYPIEVKWTEQIRPKDLKQISRYSNALIIGKTSTVSEINHVPFFPLPWHLIKLPEEEMHSGDHFIR